MAVATDCADSRLLFEAARLFREALSLRGIAPLDADGRVRVIIGGADVEDLPAYPYCILALGDDGTRGNPENAAGLGHFDYASTVTVEIYHGDQSRQDIPDRGDRYLDAVNMTSGIVDDALFLVSDDVNKGRPNRFPLVDNAVKLLGPRATDADEEDDAGNLLQEESISVWVFRFFGFESYRIRKA